MYRLNNKYFIKTPLIQKGVPVVGKLQTVGMDDTIFSSEDFMPIRKTFGMECWKVIGGKEFQAYFRRYKEYDAVLKRCKGMKGELMDKLRLTFSNMEAMRVERTPIKLELSRPSSRIKWFQYTVKATFYED